MAKPTVSKTTPILFAERIEPCLTFWEKLGFDRASEVREGDHLGFAIVTNGDVELMYQTLESIAADMPQVREAAVTSKTLLFVEVPSVAAVNEALDGAPIYMPERETFYGSTEVGYRDPAGHFVNFAQFEDE